MRATTAYKTLSTLALAALMAACASGPAPSSQSPVQPGQVATTPASMPATPLTSSQPPSIAAFDWELVSMADRQGNADTRWRIPGQRAPRLHFEGGRLTVHNLCNVVSSGYQIQGSTMLLLPGAATKRACANQQLTELEQNMALYLSAPATYELRGNAGGPPLLVLHFGDGTRWEMTGTATPQSRYGGPGERVFLEVGPQRVSCSHPLMPGAQCLQIREVRYGDNGVRQSTGQWQPLQGEIEGFEFQPGMRQVLRLHRFTLRPPLPADAAPHAYVLDTVIESEQVR
ncbi:Heat shock protein HslJ [Oryzisolibacter propanilivorax]|uniref:Heat shock protein HslJ n=1 Tax=Oryzisolibacter propanilivorax TaxID=1527607 RepID=A0A1G9SZ04_9BURK|nr:DUF4377 domain-containing protein [Oryzisolibacter propanilivorax]SDM40691.1 Heat shock protein HslJ [Oryzisolibacter propanilivorax]